MFNFLVGAIDIEVTVRLLSAVLGGAVIGLNRFLKRKAAGTRTHALVALGAGMAALFADRAEDIGAVSRVAQGLVTGVGFIGAGVIMRNADVVNGDTQIQGLTTAASIWACAIFGICCGVGELAIAGTGLVLALAVLVIGKPFEVAVSRFARDDNDPASKN
jgi:putative Mg2+ transporter-C (MgtC) family protein